MPCAAQGSATATKSGKSERVVIALVVFAILALIYSLWSADKYAVATNAKKEAAAVVLANQLRQLPAEQWPLVINKSGDTARVVEQLGDGYVINNRQSQVNHVYVANGQFFKTIWITQITDKGQETHQYKLVR